MNESYYLERLANRNIKPTAIRILVLRTMLQTKQAVSLLDLEDLLDTVDKSTLFRTIQLFHSQHLIHSIDDGTGSIKYAICQDDCSCVVADLHTHFNCENCHKTLCLENTPIPTVKLPEGFILNSINYVLKGLCSDCSSKLRSKKEK